MGRPIDEDIIIKILERWQKAFKENSHYVSASDLSLVIKDVRELPTIQPVATDMNVGDTISRQAAIDADARTARETFNLSDEYNHYLAGLMDGELAIKNLPTAQPEKAQLFKEGTTSDLISRAETVERLRRMLKATVPNTDYDEGFIDGVEFGISTVSTMPSAQPEVRTGKWIYNSPVTMKCDQCGLVIKDWDWHRFKICPNCGADMRGEKDG